MTNIRYEQISAHGTDLPAETPLYRYLSQKRFKSLIENPKLSFSKITNWDDAQEGLRFNAMKVRKPGHPYAQRNLDSFYASCWSLQTEDRRLFESDGHYQQSVDELAKDGSDAMWRAYCEKGGVRIKTTLGKLEKLFCASSLPSSELHSGRVYYDPFGSDWGVTLKSEHFALAFLQKRVSFRSEAEFRFLFCASDGVLDKDIKVPIQSLYDLIDEVLVSPAKAKDKSRSHDLVMAAQNIFPKHDFAACGNSKGGYPFCRISQLYGRVEWQSSGESKLNTDRIDEAVLALLYLGLHDGDRAWKSFDWDAMARLHEKGFISDPVGKAKSVEFTEQGLRESE
jgi:hypothetical protein